MSLIWNDIQAGQPADPAPINSLAHYVTQSLVEKVAGKMLSTNDYTTIEKEKLANIEEGAQVNPDIVNDLTTGGADKALSAEQGKVLKQLIDAGGGEGGNPFQYEELKYSEFSSIATNPDSDGVYKNVEYRRTDDTLYAQTTLLGSYPYTQVQIDYYSEAGDTIVKTITWDLTYDGNDFPYQRTVI